MVKQPANFTVDTISAGQGDVMVFVEDPEGNREEVCLVNLFHQENCFWLEKKPPSLTIYCEQLVTAVDYQTACSTFLEKGSSCSG